MIFMTHYRSLLFALLCCISAHIKGAAAKDIMPKLVAQTTYEATLDDILADEDMDIFADPRSHHSEDARSESEYEDTMSDQGKSSCNVTVGAHFTPNRINNFLIGVRQMCPDYKPSKAKLLYLMSLPIKPGAYNVPIAFTKDPEKMLEYMARGFFQEGTE